MTRAPRARSFGEVFARVPWCRRPAAGDTRGHRLTAHSPPTKHGIPIIIALAVAAASGCSNEERATDFAREYVRAAAQGNVKRLCAIRTDAALRGWGGQAACERRAKGLAIDPPPPRVGPGLRRGLTRKALAVKPRTAKVVPDDTSITGDRARVVIDFGKAVVEDGHAVGGEILEMDLKSHGDNYKVARLGFAVFPD